jgi:hypothetical protein
MWKCNGNFEELVIFWPFCEIQDLIAIPWKNVAIPHSAKWHHFFLAIAILQNPESNSNFEELVMRNTLLPFSQAGDVFNLFFAFLSLYR